MEKYFSDKYQKKYHMWKRLKSLLPLFFAFTVFAAGFRYPFQKRYNIPLPASKKNCVMLNHIRVPKENTLFCTLIPFTEYSYRWDSDAGSDSYLTIRGTIARNKNCQTDYYEIRLLLLDKNKNVLKNCIFLYNTQKGNSFQIRFNTMQNLRLLKLSAKELY